MVSAFSGWIATCEGVIHPENDGKDEGDRGDLNPRPPGPQPGALTKLSYGHRVATRMAHGRGGPLLLVVVSRPEDGSSRQEGERVGRLLAQGFSDGRVGHRA